MAEVDLTLREINFHDANAVDVVRALAAQGNYNIVTGSLKSGDTGKKVTIHMKDVSCLDAIDRVLGIAGYKYQIDGDSILISTLPADVSTTAYGKEERVIRLKHVFGDDAASYLSRIFPQIYSASGPQSNILILRGEMNDLTRAESLVLEIDRPVAQVLIEGKVIEVSESGIEELGVRWGSEAGKFKFAIDKDNGDVGLTEDILVTLSKLVGEGRAKVLAQPSVMVLEGREASINIGSRIPYAVPASVNSTSVEWTVQYLDAGVSMKITPKISDDGLISVLFRPEVSSVSEWRTTSAGEFPVITTRNAESEVMVKDGETIIIGGLINETERDNVSKIAVLGDIPLFGLLFQNRVKERTKTEVIFLVTPRVI
jgi:type II secretory pathway component GspD/PulD (secretin)